MFSKLRLVAPLAALLLVASACGGAKVGEESGGSDAGSKGKCGTVNLAINPWVGYESNAAVVAYVAEKQLGCKVVKKNILEQVAWQGFSTGVVDVIIENWGHDDLVKKYITDDKVAVDAGSTGVPGKIGWFVPPWLAKEHPDVLDWKNLNKYAAEFKTSESGGKGQFLAGDPSYVTNDAALVQNLKLNFKVVYSGSETALITAMRQAEQQKKWLIMYFYTPQWFLNEVPAVNVKLPEYKSGCDADAKKVACDYPEYDLNKIVSKKFADSGSPAYTLVKNFTWTAEDQNEVAKAIAVDKLPAEDAAKKWVEAHQDKVDAWLQGT
ncbi:ABC transporter substrate-binding protein [Cryptosporangium arvum]|uniref:ABC-type proline/glycine betaine transport system, periplasmic component n=1 Tax=Cryptosporangium arvum DSM 44712 TaxID=927661 RepID=A0A011ACQ6_9ACTN|nr:ABC transporter substrate-binding protein [Cryptosporangium arvum]EXG79821.1 ABC-type proline/glycine betaine transport system, periplasmic component [Cryptosporangium arvum DSM 44712]